ncbi:MAG: alanine racemase, partial [Longimicrobiales bacterium]
MANTLDDLLTPAAVVDLGLMHANLDRMAGYTADSGLGLRPHTKTHKTPELAREQLRRGAVGVTVATVHEADVMSAVADDILIAHPPVSRPKLERLTALPEELRLTVALDSEEALEGLAAACRAANRIVGVLIELDVGMRRVGVSEPARAVALARAARDSAGVELRGILFYPGHIREPVAEQTPALERLRAELDRFIVALDDAGFAPGVVSGGSTPTAYASHNVQKLTEVRPGTYIFNDRTTYAIDACTRDDCAYT